MNKEVLKKLYSSTEKVELSEVKVDLALVDDIRKQTDIASKSASAFVNIFKTISTQKDAAISNGESYYQTADQLKKDLQQFEIKSKELGIDPLTNKDYKAANDLLIRYDINAVFKRVDSLRKIV